MIKDFFIPVGSTTVYQTEKKKQKKTRTVAPLTANKIKEMPV